MNFRGRFGRNVAWNLVSDAVARGASLWLAVFCARVLGVEDFGRLTFALAVVQYLWLIGDAALNAGYATREIARVQESKALAALFWKARLAAAAAVAAIVLAVSAIAPLPTALRGTLIAAAAFFPAMAAFPDWLLRGRQSFRALATASAAGGVALVVTSFALLPSHRDPALAALIWAGSFGVAALVALPAALPWVRRAVRAETSIPATPEGWWPHFKRSIVFSMGSVLAIGTTQLPTLAVGAWSGPQETGLFGAGFRFLLGGVALIAVLWWPLLPVLTGVGDDVARFRHSVARVARVLFAVTIPTAAVVSLLARPLLVHIYGADYARGATALAVVIWALPAYGAAGILEQSCLALGRERQRARAWGAALVFSLATAALCVPRWGGLGAAVGLLGGLAIAIAMFAVALRDRLAAPSGYRHPEAPDARAARFWPQPPPSLSDTPLVSVVLAVRNEEPYIERALAAVLAQDYAGGRIEVLVVDGDSSDATVALVQRVAGRDRRVRLLGNPRRHVAAGLNLGIAAARGEVIVRVDGHCAVPPDYVSACIAMLRAAEGEAVGGPVRAEGDTALARAIALAMSTPFGVGGAAFRWASSRRPVDHLPFAAWRRQVFDVIGGFDETLERNQDDELSDRLRRAGGRIIMNPGIPVRYWSRRTLGSLWRQYRGYGFYKVRVMARRGGRPSSLRQLAPATLVLAVVTGLAVGVASGRWIISALTPAAYGAFLAVATARTAARTRSRAAMLVPAALATMQVAYGIGFIAALVRAATGGVASPAHVPIGAPAPEPVGSPAAPEEAASGTGGDPPARGAAEEQRSAA